MAGDENKDDQQSHNEHKPHNTKHKFRTRLPAKMFDRSQISIWSILKQFIGKVFVTLFSRNKNSSINIILNKKELSKIAMPAALCEPLSFLQRITENVYYSDLLNKAADPTISASPCKRMEYVAAYAITNISSNIDRLSKPFNPLLGETYELVREDLGFRVICEQVSHHPPVSAFHCDSTTNNNWKFYGTVNPKIKFWGKSIEVTPKGTLTLELNKFNETYTWQAVTCCVHNIIVGKLWFEYYGTMEITCHQTGYKAVINFKPYSWSNKELHKLDGYIYDNKKNKLKALYGYWTHCVYSCDANEYDNYMKTNKPLPMTRLDELFNELPSNRNINNRHHAHSEANFLTEQKTTDNSSKNGHLDNDEQKLVDETQSKLSINLASSSSSISLTAMAGSVQLNSTELWRALPRPSHAPDYYMFNYFTMTLNELKEDFEKVIAPTDSRFRTDVKKLELGDLDAASQEKTRLEEKQRESRKNSKHEYKGKWFQLSKHPLVSEEAWLFNNKYWLRNYSDCLNLY